MILASTYGPKHVKAWHTNMPDQVPPSALSRPIQYLSYLLSPYDKHDRAALRRKDAFINTGSGYMHEQKTKPQTLGYSLADSPVGLLAWIYEKLFFWTDNYAWSDDESEHSDGFVVRIHC